MVTEKDLDLIIDGIVEAMVAGSGMMVKVSELNGAMSGYCARPRIVRKLAVRICGATGIPNEKEQLDGISHVLGGLHMAALCGAILDQAGASESLRFAALDKLYHMGVNPPDKQLFGEHAVHGAFVLPELLRATDNKNSPRIAMYSAWMLSRLQDEGMDLLDALFRLIEAGRMHSESARIIFPKLQAMEESYRDWDRTCGVLISGMGHADPILAFLAMDALAQLVTYRLYQHFIGLARQTPEGRAFRDQFKSAHASLVSTPDGRREIAGAVTPIVLGTNTAQQEGVALALSSFAKKPLERSERSEPSESPPPSAE